MPRFIRPNVTRLNTPTKASKSAEAAKPIAADKPEDLTEKVTPIKKPSSFSFDKFKSKRTGTIANVGTLPSALPHHSAPEAKDFVRLHPDEENYWSPELCFVDVPTKGGQKRDTMHLIDEDLALRWLDGGKIKRFRLALASKPHDVFFLCHVPSQNLDNGYNESNIEGCECAKTKWVTLVSRKATEGIERYKTTFAFDLDAFPAPSWPTQTLTELIETAFAGRMIDREDHPAMNRLLGRRQTTS